MEEAFEAERSNLLGLAYRMLGSRADAEDMVQETYVRVRRAAVAPDNVAGYLTRTCVRLCLDRLKSAQRRREQYVGPWLPEPFLQDRAAAEQAEFDESLSLALLTALECLSPAERAALLLHDVFDYGFDEVASILGKSPVACRQLATRARSRLRHRRVDAHVKTPQAEYEMVAKAFFAALRTGNLDDLKQTLAADVVLRSDGGGRVLAARRPVEGAAKVALFLSRTIMAGPIPECELVHFNGLIGLVVRENMVPRAAFQVHVVHGRVSEIAVLRNPDKLDPFLGPRKR